MKESRVRTRPWADRNGRPCFLRTDENGDTVTHASGDVEAEQLRTAGELLDNVAALMSNGKISEAELRFTVEALSESLTSTLRIAVRLRAALKLAEGRE
jgi:hypothetical protein